jgi:hypothetical protein
LDLAADVAEVTLERAEHLFHAFEDGIASFDLAGKCRGKASR